MLTRLHERISSENEILKVDDSAAMTYVGSSNFVVANLMTAQEHNSVLGMIRSAPCQCQSQFLQYLRLMHPACSSADGAMKGVDAPGDKKRLHLLQQPRAHVDGCRRIACLGQFSKELTRSDVGKLNRLVIPKRHAMECFPHVDSTSAVLEFVDRGDRRWRFRYCFWKSSQSCVFTRGWNNFVREKRLRAGDVVVFRRCKEMKQGCRRTYWSIDTIPRGGAVQNSDEHNCRVAEMEQEAEEVDEEASHVLASSPESCELMEEDKKEKGFQLFGVWMPPGEEK